MFKNNKIMRLWLLSLATTSVAAQAETKEETITVTQGVSEEPTAPVKGIVATKTLSATKTSAEIVKTPQSVSVITRDQMNMQDVTSVSQALRYSAGVFTEYRGSSNRNDEVFVRGFSYVPKFLDGLALAQRPHHRRAQLTRGCWSAWNWCAARPRSCLDRSILAG